MYKLILFAALIALATLLPNAYSQSVSAPITDTFYNPPENGGVRRWRVLTSDLIDVYSAPSRNTPITNTVNNEALLASLGCEEFGGDTWCSVKTIRTNKQGFILVQYLQPATGLDGKALLGINNSSKLARQNAFDAQGTVLCSQERGQEMGECKVGVAHAGGGDAAAVVSFPNGFKRTLYFVNGEFISANTTMSGNGSDTDWQMDSDLHIIRVDDQRYELNNNLIYETN